MCSKQKLLFLGSLIFFCCWFFSGSFHSSLLAPWPPWSARRTSLRWCSASPNFQLSSSSPSSASTVQLSLPWSWVTSLSSGSSRRRGRKSGKSIYFVSQKWERLVFLIEIQMDINYGFLSKIRRFNSLIKSVS